jgi:hypothetical protein
MFLVRFEKCESLKIGKSSYSAIGKSGLLSVKILKSGIFIKFIAILATSKILITHYDKEFYCPDRFFRRFP